MNMSVSTVEADGASKQHFDPSFDRDGIPLCVCWSVHEVATWIDHLGFPQYQECFIQNYIDGRKLICIDASSLPKIGVTDFKHIQTLTRAIRRQLGIEDPDWDRSITLPERDSASHFLERKSMTGSGSASLTYPEHVRYLKEFARHGVPEK